MKRYSDENGKLKKTINQIKAGNTVQKLENLLEVAEDLDWSYHIYENEDYYGYVELQKYSPAGEDFIMIINFNKNNPVKTFLSELKDYYIDFDVDDHVEIYASCRGENGVPVTFRELVEDAEEIERMIEELCIALSIENFK